MERKYLHVTGNYTWGVKRRLPQPLFARLMSARGTRRPQSPASWHMAACLLVCYFHWFLNVAGCLFKAKMKLMGFKGQKCQWAHPPARPRHERIRLSCRSHLQLPLRPCDGPIATHRPHWRYMVHPISTGESRRQNAQLTSCVKDLCNLHSNTSGKICPAKKWPC